MVTLGSSALGVMTVPATATFPNGQNSVTFQATPVGAGATVLSAGNADATATPLNVTVAVRPEYLAYDDASLCRRRLGAGSGACDGLLGLD